MRTRPPARASDIDGIDDLWPPVRPLQGSSSLPQGDNLVRTGEPGRHRVSPSHATSRFFPDWLGEVQVQQDVTRGPRLETFAGLDPRRWIVVGVSFELTPLGERGDRFFVDAVDFGAIEVEPGSVGFSALRAAADRQSVVPVTRIELTGATLRDMLAHVARGRISLHANGIGTATNVVAVRQHDVNGSARTGE